MNLLAALRKPRAAAAPRVAPPLLPVLRKYPPADTFVISRVREVANGQTVYIDHMVSQYRLGVLIGEAGAGKSSALNFLWRRGLQPDGSGGPADASIHAGAPLSLADYHPRALPQDFKNSRLILLDDIQPSHAEYLSHLAQEFPRARIFATSRNATGLPPEFTRLTLQSFHERELKSAVEAWFPPGQGREHAGRRLGLRAGEAFLALVHSNAGIRFLASNPLDLFLLIQVYAEGGSLPSRRAELFDTYLRMCLQSEWLAPTSTSGGAATAGDPDFAARALEGIALSTKRGQLAQEEHLARGYGLLRKRASGRVAFAHESVHDFLAARALRRNPELTLLREYLDDENWSGVVLFYAGLGDPRPVVEALLERGQSDLAARALGQAQEIPEDLYGRAAGALIPRAWEEDDAAAIAALAACSAGLTAPHRDPAVDFFAARLKEREPAARARAARILGQLHGDRPVEALLPQLRDTNPDVREQVVIALGQSHNTRVLEPLLVALRGDARGGVVDTRMRAAAARALGELGGDKAVPALIVDLAAEPEVRAAATQALIVTRSNFAVKPLQALVDSNQPAEVRAAAEQILQSM